MSPEQAKIFLREHVCDDDVDAAIALLITTFINTQKTSVRSSLGRGFRKYLAHHTDLFDLLLHALRSLMREAQTYAILRANKELADAPIEFTVSVGDFEAKVHELNFLGDLEEQASAYLK